MKHFPFALLLWSVLPASASASADVSPSLPIRQEAPPDGWAAQAGGTRGGADAAAANVFTVTDAVQLRSALSSGIKGSRIVQVAGVIDMSEGRPFASTADQARRGRVALPANTTLVGIGAGAGFVNAHLKVAKVSQVIIRNLNLRNPCDVAPRWDPTDGKNGNWNAQFDSISITGSTHVWIDRNSFTDAPVLDDTLPVENGKPRQCHDGTLDISDASDYVTVSYNHFALHDKTMLIGASDKAVQDAGRLRVTISNNLFEYVASRAPRVRFGQVHLFNNYYVGDRRHPVYRHGYSVGVAKAARIVSHANAFEIAGARTCLDAIRPFASGADAGLFTDSGSLLNGAALAPACSNTGNPGDTVAWAVPYPFKPLPADAVPAHVRAHAGAGK
ncbi:pectate lyase family protein [Massilia consociata]|uniref:Polysaccharide lyase family 1 protein n=1 Tax=Massilia consociata TaxID=760117 RepID=A0ABV6FIV0_9BURK